MAERKYLLMQLDGKEILSQMSVEQDMYSNYAPVFRFSENSTFRRILEHTDYYNENALFYQMKKCVLENNLNADQKWTENSLKGFVFFVDFSQAFIRESDDDFSSINNINGVKNTLSKDEWKNVSVDCKCFWLFKKGFQIVSEQGDVRVFLPFDRSDSMARESRILFIDEWIYTELNRRLMLGFDLSDTGISVNLSKFYANRGKYLTNGTRIESDSDFPLNEETVVVIPDDNTPIELEWVYTAEKKEEGSNRSRWEKKKNTIIKEKHIQDLMERA